MATHVGAVLLMSDRLGSCALMEFIVGFQIEKELF